MRGQTPATKQRHSDSAGIDAFLAVIKYDDDSEKYSFSDPVRAPDERSAHLACADDDPVSMSDMRKR